MSTSDSFTSKSNNDVCDVNDMLQNMNTANKDSDTSVCANCGKVGDDVTNTCNKCKQVKYCNAACKKKHRHNHKKDCEEHVRLADERAAKLHDEELFKQPPPLEDCPICFARLPTLHTGRRYMSCCGKVVCSGCFYAPLYDDQGNKLNIDKQNECAFCRTTFAKSNKVSIERKKKRIDADDVISIYNHGCDYYDGKHGFPQDYTKALELWHRAAGLGYAKACKSIGHAYNNGEGVEVDKKKAISYYELAAIGGEVTARFNLGNNEARAGNMERALKHYMISARDGLSDSLEMIKELYSTNHATKDDYMKALQSYQAYLGEIKSKQRDEAAAAGENYRYY